MRAASSSRLPRPRSSPRCSTSICGVTPSRDATNSSTSIASANGSKMLVDTGQSVAARNGRRPRQAAGDRRLVPLRARVRPGHFEPVAQSDDEPMDRRDAMMKGTRSMLAVCRRTNRAPTWLECEVAATWCGRGRTDAWDAIVTLLVTLETEHGHYFHAVMEGCRRLSNSRPEIDGLDDLLLAPEQHLHDVASERERRRSQQGYATPADARAFLQMARQPTHTRSSATAPRRPTRSPPPTFAPLTSDTGPATAPGPSPSRWPEAASLPSASPQWDGGHAAGTDGARNTGSRHRTAGRGRRDAGTAAGAARSADEDPEPAGSQLEAADGPRPRRRRAHLLHAQS